MADRTVYGLNFSENGWRMVDAGSCVWVKVPGTSVTLLIREGQPAAIMGAFAADYNAHVEPLRDDDSACWTPTNKVTSSNHLSGTGMDLNWNGPDGRTFRLGITKERAYPGDKSRKLDELIDFYEGMIYCGGNWDIRDWMHFQMGENTYGSQNVAKVNDFIRRKIRSDGFSTFRRDTGAPAPAPPAPPTRPAGPDPVDVLARATGLTRERAAQILPTMSDGLRQAKCTTPPRIGMFIAQTQHEADDYNATEEYASGEAYNGRVELGNTQPGDGPRFKGRTWIQVTGRTHYAEFSRWAFDRGLISSPTYFVDHPTELADVRWAGIGAAWYWITTRRPTRRYPTLNEASDARDVLTATQIVNGGTRGLAERNAFYNRAMALGDQLLALVNTTTPQDPWEELFNMELDSTSAFATPDEDKIPVSAMVQAIDAATHRRLVLDDCELGDEDAIFRLIRAARGQDSKYTDAANVRKWKRALTRFIRNTAVDAADGDETAVQILDHLQTTYPDVLQEFLAARKGA